MTPVPLARLDPWYSAAPTSVAVPNHVPSRTSRNRFNDGSGTFALHYLAASPFIALIEAAALHGAYATGFVAAPQPRSWTVYHYEIVGPPLDIVDFADPIGRSQVSTTVQELTGDWLGYHHRHQHMPATPPPVHGSPPASPTQELARRVYRLPDVRGFLAPSAKVPLTANLVLFFHRLPPGVLRHRGTATVVI